ncbi:MAG: hypothetical protein M3Y69_11805 [Verrucomicrobiota bacterium]|nr:hypothetical protein [Verrucomicrobiota bacterium]
MRTLVFLIFCLLTPVVAFAQTAQNASLKGQPIEITSTGGTEYRDSIATAKENVAIHIGDADIYGDYGEYNATTHVVRVTGNVRIYRGAELYVGESGTYNTETQEITASNLRSLEFPYFLSGETVNRTTDEKRDDETLTLVQKGYFTTHDALNPDFRLTASTVRIYENDYIVFKNMVFYVGKIPIFYFPYLYQSLDDAFSFLVSPAYTSAWGPSLLNRLSFPIGKRIKAVARLDYRLRRGVAAGLSATTKYGTNKSSWAKLGTYFLDDQNPEINRTTLPRGAVPTFRYRLSLDNRTDFGHDITGDVQLTRLSDAYVLQDFFQNEFRLTPDPDNLVTLRKWSPNYSLTAFTRFQMNNFSDVTERLPEVALDIKRQPIFGSGVFYEGESSFANLQRSFPNGSFLQDYSTLRLDTFHQLTYPNTYFGWLSVVPRIGVRATYYDTTRNVSPSDFVNNPDPLFPAFTLYPADKGAHPLREGDALLRTALNAGVEASFKISRTWENAQNRLLGLDGLRHIIQPFTNFSYVTGDNLDPARILQFDRYVPTTQLPPIDFPQFTSIDSIDNWSIMRVGVRQRLQTRRDDSTINWMELQTFFDVNFDNPYDRRNFSGLYNRFGFNPVPWFGVGVSSQLPVFGNGYTEMNTDVHIQPISNLSFNLSHRFLSENPFFPTSSLYTGSAYWRVDDNWGLGIYERYEANTGFVEEQRLSVHRDLTSWVASVSAVIRNNGSRKDYGVLLTFTLKALPKFSFDLNFDPGGTNDPNRGL